MGKSRQDLPAPHPQARSERMQRERSLSQSPVLLITDQGSAHEVVYSTCVFLCHLIIKILSPDMPQSAQSASSLKTLSQVAMLG